MGARKLSSTIGLEVNTDMWFATKDKGNLIRFLPDSREQIASSIEMVGLRGKLDQAVQAAIARARGHSQRSRQVAIKTPEVDSADEAR